MVICDPGIDCLDSRTVIARAHSLITERPLKDLRLEEQYGLSLQRLRRRGQVMDDLPPDLQAEPGDELLLTGSTRCVCGQRPLISPADARGRNHNG
ncbi:MAG: TrkA C-terminal domain-containing protein [Pyrinomonadaceae bacterium]